MRGLQVSIEVEGLKGSERPDVRKRAALVLSRIFILLSTEVHRPAGLMAGQHEVLHPSMCHAHHSSKHPKTRLKGALSLLQLQISKSFRDIATLIIIN